MGFLYCPNCDKGISDLATIPACPDCFHPFNARMWLKESKKQMEERQRVAAFEAEQRKKREQEDAWRKSGRCEYCGGYISSEYKNAGGKVARWETVYECSSCGRRCAVYIPKPPLKHSELDTAFRKMNDIVREVLARQKI
jgi:threonine synthase